jgi:hypothetical protein
LGRKVFTYLIANVVKVLGNARVEGIKKAHLSLKEGCALN